MYSHIVRFILLAQMYIDNKTIKADLEVPIVIWHEITLKVVHASLVFSSEAFLQQHILNYFYYVTPSLMNGLLSQIGVCYV